MMTSAQQRITRQRDAPGIFLQTPLTELVALCARVWNDAGMLIAALSTWSALTL